MQFNIILAGCGNLGSRHLQALKKTQRDITITVCEPFEKAREISQDRYAQIEENEHVKDFRMLADYHDLKQGYDLAIIATNAENRFAIAKWLVENTGIRYLILEKVVFQTFEELDEFKRILDKHKVKAWVNCPRRMYPYYQELKLKLRAEKRMNMIVSGGSWGMGSNAIHMLDVYAYLTGFQECRHDNLKLEERLEDSKRSGYKEFFGELKFITDKGELLLYCDHGNSPVEIKVITPKEEISIRESDGIVRFQSELTNLVVEKIMDFGEADLAHYDESVRYHKIVLGSFLEHINRYSEEEIRRCPIT